MAKMKSVRFSELDKLPTEPGLYEVHAHGEPLKVGIARNLRSRLQHHLASRQRYLKLKQGGSFANPNDVISKRSILAKHLFFDRSISRQHDLRSEEGRRTFLSQECVIRYVITLDRHAARQLEISRERSMKFRYVGRTQIR
jgi:hypothetical protein